MLSEQIKRKGILCNVMFVSIKHLSITQSKVITNGIFSQIKFRILNPEMFDLSVICLHVSIMYLISSDILHCHPLGSEKIETSLQIEFNIICSVSVRVISMMDILILRVLSLYESVFSHFFNQIFDENTSFKKKVLKEKQYIKSAEC